MGQHLENCKIVNLNTPSLQHQFQFASTHIAADTVRAVHDGRKRRIVLFQTHKRLRRRRVKVASHALIATRIVIARDVLERVLTAKHSVAGERERESRDQIGVVVDALQKHAVLDVLQIRMRPRVHHAERLRVVGAQTLMHLVE